MPRPNTDQIRETCRNIIIRGSFITKLQPLPFPTPCTNEDFHHGHKREKDLRFISTVAELADSLRLHLHSIFYGLRGLSFVDLDVGLGEGNLFGHCLGSCDV